MEKIDWSAKRRYETEYHWEKGKFCTTYAITFKIFKGDYMFYKKVFRYVLAPGEDLQTMLKQREKSIAILFQLW